MASAEMIAIFPGCDLPQLKNAVFARLGNPGLRAFMVNPGVEMNEYSEFYGQAT